MKTTSTTCSQNRPASPVTGHIKAAVALLIALLGSGCAVKPWQHDLMAQKAMQPDAYPIETNMDEHIYFSKEGSSGGRSFAGGGCGCN